MSKGPRKIIAHLDDAKLTSVQPLLLRLGVWDDMTKEEREALINRGEVWNTKPGRVLRDEIVNAIEWHKNRAN